MLEEENENISAQSETDISGEQNNGNITDETQSSGAHTKSEKTSAPKKEEKKSIGREIFEWFYTIVIAVVIAFLIKGFLFDIVKVDGESMLPTLHDRDRLIISKLGYSPEQGDIIILDSNYTARGEYFEQLADNGQAPGFFQKLKTRYFGSSSYKEIYYVKRIVALPGQTVDVRDGKIYVDGAVYEDGYHQGETLKTDPSMVYPHTVGEQSVFVLGDNREHSKDSRIIGDVPYDAILGKAQLRIWPLSDIGSVY